MAKEEGGWAWVIVASCFCVAFLSDGIQYSYGLLFIEFVREFKQSKATTSWIGGLFYGWFICGPVGSILTNRFGCRAVVVAGGAFCFTGFLVSAFSTSVYFLYVSFGCLGGIGFFLLCIPREIIIVQYFVKKRSFATGISVCGSGIGTIVFGPLTKWLIDEYGWRGTLLIEAGLVLNCVACGLVMRPFVETPDNTKYNEDTAAEMDMIVTSKDNVRNGYHEVPIIERQSDDVTNDTGTTKRANEKHKPLYNFNLLRQPKTIIFILCCFFEGIAYYTPFTFLPDMVVHSGWSRAQAALLMTAIGIVNTVFRIPFGKMADASCVNRTLLLSITFGMMGVSCIVMPFIASFGVMVAVCIFFATGLAMYVVVSIVIVPDLFGEKDATDVYGMAYLVFGLGSLIAGPAAGALFDASGNYRLTYATTGVGFLLSGVLVFILFHMPRERVTREKVVQSCALLN